MNSKDIGILLLKNYRPGVIYQGLIDDLEGLLQGNSIIIIPQYGISPSIPQHLAGMLGCSVYKQ